MNRRKFLIASASTITVGLAGCMSNTIEEYPDGLTEEGIEDVDALFGSESPYLSSDSVRINITTDSNNTTTETTIEVNSEQENSFVRTTESLPEQSQQSGQRVVLRYHTGDTRYERIVTESDGEITNGPRYRRTENQFTKNVEFYANFLRDLLTDIEFSESEITEEGLIRYEAEEIGSDNSLSPESESIEDVTMSITFSEDGRPQNITAEITAVQQSRSPQPPQSGSEDTEQETRTIEQEIQFSNYNDVEVTEPDWLEEADQQVEERQANQPDGDVSFSESDGEVTVTIDSLENTETVDIVVDGEIGDRGVEEGDSLTYENPSSVQVVSQTESGRLIRIGSYSAE